MRVEPFDTQRHIIFSRRATLFSGGALVLFAGLGGRLYQLQVHQHKDYAARAYDNRYNQSIVTPLRGEVYDRFGIPMASNRQSFRVLIVPEETDSATKSLAAVHQLVPISPAHQKRIMRDISRKRAFTPIIIGDDLSWEEFAAINFKNPELPGIRSEVGDTRSYPWKDHTAMILGYVGVPSDKDIAATKNRQTRILFRQPGFRLGLSGIERHHDEHLRGQAGSKTVEVNAHGRIIGEKPNLDHQPQQGKSIGLTIDVALQSKAMEILSDNTLSNKKRAPDNASGAGVVMDIETGDILVLASTPSFDPDAFNRGISSLRWKELNSSRYKPLLNKSLSGLYPPGSTFKLLTCIAAQEAGFTPDHTVTCTGKIWYGNRFFNCWKKEGHGSVAMKGALKHSCDVYFWDIARRLDINFITDVAKRYGFGQVFDLGIDGQKKGVVPGREWKREYFRSNPTQQTWFPGETLSVAIGQGYTTSTPLQLAVMTARIASGRQITPRLVRVANNMAVKTPSFPILSGDHAHLDIVREGMDAVVNAWGTAARSRLTNPDWRMAGKTGTSQLGALRIDPVTGERVKNKDLKWHQRDHALFVCYAPFEKPRYACAVVMEHGGSGSAAAAPKASKIMRAVLEKDPMHKKAFNPDTDTPMSLTELLVRLREGRDV